MATRAGFHPNRSVTEIADILRRHCQDYARTHAAHLGRVERRVMSAITACRTAALGGHVQDVGTDSREYGVLARQAHSGALEGAQIPAVVKPLKETAYVVDILAASVLGSILQNYVASAAVDPATQLEHLTKFHLPPSLQGLIGGAFV